MSEPSSEAIEFVARWACEWCEDGIGPGDKMPNCEYCEAHRKHHAVQLDAFAAKAVAAELSELEKRAVEDRDTWSSLKLHDKANAVDAIVVAIRVRIGRARGKDVENG